MLVSVDDALRSRGIEFFRFAGKFRLFASTYVDAQRALEILASLLHAEGLSLGKHCTIDLAIDRASANRGSLTSSQVGKGCEPTVSRPIDRGDVEEARSAQVDVADASSRGGAPARAYDGPGS